MPPLLAPDHGLNQGPAREVAAADSLHKDTAVLRPSGAHLFRVLHRVLRAVHTVATPGHPLLLDPMQEPPELTVSGEDLRHTEREDAVTSFQPLLKEGTYHLNDGVPSSDLRDV
ncbi:hypothetical protein PYW07_011449 [Mythimna separata]|uniref:Uncharacterized protein n=1 Tax=Mythimna separata TaxID=271217 RepID=A0AAD8DL89_MYTSE|nr:hypothetical protein PYW07_011449 [Mythimna separata]